MTFFDSLRSAARKHAAYSRTRRELAAMPRETALDLGMFPEDAARTARHAVYA